MNKISRTWSLMSECWQILKQDKRILLFPLISGICCLLLLASFAIPLYATGAWHPPGRHSTPAQQVAYYAVLFVFYVCNYFIITFFNAAIIGWTALRLGGGRPTLALGLRMAAARLHLIIGWALVSATVGLIIRIIEDRSDKIGSFVAGLIGMAWTIISFFVVPVLVLENKGPIKALQESTSLLKRTWGEQLTSRFSFGLIFFLLTLPAVAVVALAFMAGGVTVGIIAIVPAVIYVIVLSLVQSALQAIFQTVLYMYAQSGQIPSGFDPDTLKGAWS